MAAWTLPNRITDWCEILTTALDRRSRKYFLTIILGMLCHWALQNQPLMGASKPAEV